MVTSGRFCPNMRDRSFDGGGYATQWQVCFDHGSSRGIGRDIALKLAGQGARTAVHYYENEDAAKATLAKVRELDEAGWITGQLIDVDGGALLMDAHLPLELQGWSKKRRKLPEAREKQVLGRLSRANSHDYNFTAK